MSKRNWKTIGGLIHYEPARPDPRDEYGEENDEPAGPATDRRETRTRRTAFIVGLALALGLPMSAQAYTCHAEPDPADTICGNPEFQECLIDVSATDSSGIVHTEPRHYCIHVPETVAAQSLPVIFGFHGGGGDASRMEAIWEKHTEQGMVLVFPTALESENPPPLGGCTRSWRTLDSEHPLWSSFEDLDPCPHPDTGGQTPYSHDLAMVQQISRDIVDQGVVPQGFFAAGFSDGAGMVQQLFITEASADAFDGFATAGIGISQTRMDAVGLSGSGLFQPNPGIRKPIVITAGTGDKSFVPWENMINAIDDLIATGLCPASMSEIGEFITCYRTNETFDGLGNHAMISTYEATLSWFVDHNASVMPAIESLYPDLGHGTSFHGNDDRTLAVRQDFRGDPSIADSAAVAGIALLHGRHNWPGNNGNAPTCTIRNCDIDMTEEVLQFWRANAGLVSEWP